MPNGDQWKNEVDPLRQAAIGIMQKPVPETMTIPKERRQYALVDAVARYLMEKITEDYADYTHRLPQKVAILDEAIVKIAKGQAHLLDDKERSLLELEPDPADPRNKFRLKNDVIGEAARYVLRKRYDAEIEVLTEGWRDADEVLQAKYPDAGIDCHGWAISNLESKYTIARALLALQEDVLNLAGLFSRQRSR